MTEFLSEEGTLLRRDVWTILQQSSCPTHSARDGGSAYRTGNHTAWDVFSFSKEHDAFGESSAHSATKTDVEVAQVEAFFASLSAQSSVKPVQRILQVADQEPLKSGAGVTHSPLQHSVLSSILSPSECVATFAVVDAETCFSSAALQSARGTPAVKVLASHQVQWYLSSATGPLWTDVTTNGGGSSAAIFPSQLSRPSQARHTSQQPNAAASPTRTTMSSPTSSSSIRIADRVIGFEVCSLSPKVVTVLAPLISHWIVVGGVSTCSDALHLLSRTFSALRDSGSPVGHVSATDVSIVVQGPDTETTEDCGALLSLCSALTSSTPSLTYVNDGGSVAVASVAKSLLSPRRGGLPSRGSGGTSAGKPTVLLESAGGGTSSAFSQVLRNIVCRTRPLLLGSGSSTAPTAVQRTPLRLVAHILSLSSSPSTGFSIKAALEVSVAQCVAISSALYRHLLAEGLHLVSQTPLLAANFATVEDLEGTLRKASRAFFLDLCGALSPSASVFDRLESNIQQITAALAQELREEAFHIAQSSVAAAVRPLADQLQEHPAKPVDPLKWSSQFHGALEQYLSTPLLQVDANNHVGDHLLAAENIVIRKWATHAKRSAAIDITMQWFLPNVEVILSQQREQTRLREAQRESALKSAYERLAATEEQLADVKRERDLLSEQTARVHAAADALQETHNAVQMRLSQTLATSASALQRVKADRARQLFFEENTRNERDDPQADDYTRTAADSSHSEAELERTLSAALSELTECLHLLGAPTHGLLITAATSGGHLGVNGAYRRQTPPPSSLSTSMVNLGEKSVNYSTMSVGAAAAAKSAVVKSPRRQKKDALGGGTVVSSVQAARRDAELEREKLQREKALSRPPSPILGPAPQVAGSVELPDFTRRAPKEADQDLLKQEQRVQATVAMISELQQRVVALSNDLASSESSLRFVECRLRDTAIELSVSREHEMTRAAEAKAAHNELNLAKGALEQERREVEASMQEIARLQTEAQHMRGLRDADAIRISQLEATLQNLETTHKELSQALTGEAHSLRSQLDEERKKNEVLKLSCTVSDSNAHQYRGELAQLERALQRERKDNIESKHRHEQRIQQVLDKLDETVIQYDNTLREKANASAEVVRQLQSDTVNLRAENAGLQEQLRAAVAKLSQLEPRLQEQTEKLSKSDAALQRVASELEKASDAAKVLEVKLLSAHEDVRSRDHLIAQLKEDLRQSKEARRMLCHSMDALEILIQEQKMIGADGGGHVSLPSVDASLQRDSLLAVGDGSMQAALHELPSAMSVIRAVAAESIARDDSAAVSPGMDRLRSLPQPAAPLSQRGTKLSASIPLSLSQLMLDGNNSNASMTGEEGRATPPQGYRRDFVGLDIPALAARNVGAGPRPLGPHLQALAAIDTLA